MNDQEIVDKVWNKLFPYKVGDRIEMLEGYLGGKRGIVFKVDTGHPIIGFQNHISLKMDEGAIVTFWFNDDYKHCFRRIADEDK